MIIFAKIYIFFASGSYKLYGRGRNINMNIEPTSFLISEKRKEFDDITLSNFGITTFLCFFMFNIKLTIQIYKLVG